MQHSRAHVMLPEDHFELSPETYHPGDAREFVCGWGAASINILMTFPLNKLIFRQQIYGIQATTAMQQLQQEGALKLYRGVLPPLLQKTSTLSIMFGMYDQFNKLFSAQFGQLPLRLRHGSAAVLAGCLEATLAPFERIQTLLQDRQYHVRFRNMAHAIQELGPNFGIREYYRGLTAILLRNGPSNAVFFLLREELKQNLPPVETPTAEIGVNFICGGILGAFISTIFFPINVVKTRMQSQLGGKFESFFSTMLVVYNERNRSVALMFRGVHINCFRSLLSWGIINASYEFLKGLMYDASSRT